MEEKFIPGREMEPAMLPTSDEKTLALLAHVLTLVAGFFAPLIIYLVKKDSSFVAYHAKESLNFQITLLIIGVLLFITVIGILLLWLVGIIAVVLVILATIKTSEGKLYKYPFSIKLIR